ncbi:translation initiation factor IF-3 [Candidatus Phytoplasma solani]|uniref:Translation initiation factor IF-3 n=1 Tax=Candidatus Phytoplasma solani TaxID=69896 RepID=A0A421NYB4_9MOLU|nr:translation initiation factor IF-3 [Candidatus Phytoplasma solani]RMI88998.1 translation initiation factor IF-3 [Candidatus Phytoplasma solani]CCP88451.1 Translation initiation factor IF-3 [Candidatus Phytoplasma solani]
MFLFFIEIFFLNIYVKLKEVLDIKLFKTKKSPNNKDLYNDRIPQGSYLIIDEKGQKLGIFNRTEALKLSEEKEIDIVIVNADSNPMVARLMDYQKHRYNQQKKNRETKKKAQVSVLKEIRLSPTINTHDLNTKLKQVHKFLKQGNKVKISMRFRGRMINNYKLGETVLKQIIQDLTSVAQIENPLKLQGNQFTAVLTPSK